MTEDLVPHVDAQAVPAGSLTVLGRVPEGATREEAVTHLAEAARLVRRRDTTGHPMGRKCWLAGVRAHQSSGYP
jgi:hypothetical protein